MYLDGHEAYVLLDFGHNFVGASTSGSCGLCAVGADDEARLGY